MIEGGVNGEVFVEYVRRVLTPELEPGQVVVLDNLGAHKRAEVRSLIEARGCRLLFLPPNGAGPQPGGAAVLEGQGRAAGDRGADERAVGGRDRSST